MLGRSFASWVWAGVPVKTARVAGESQQRASEFTRPQNKSTRVQGMQLWRSEWSQTRKARPLPLESQNSRSGKGLIGSAATIAGRERVCPRDISTQSPEQVLSDGAPCYYQIFKLTACPSFPWLPHRWHLLLARRTFWKVLYNLRGTFLCPQFPRLQVFLFVGTRPVSASFQSVSHRGVVVCLFFTKPTQLDHPPPTFQGPRRVSSEVLTHPDIVHLCSERCISPLILPPPHLTSGRIAKGIFDIPI